MSRNRNPSHFIRKLQQILENSLFQDIIFWEEAFGVLHLKNCQALIQKVIPIYFKQKSLKSFIRQLNLYGFRKIVRQKQTLIFKNPDFTRANIQQGKFIKRCLNKKKSQVTQKQTSQNNLVIIQQKQTKNEQKQVQKNITEQKPTFTRTLFISPKIHSSCNIECQHKENSFLNFFNPIIAPEAQNIIKGLHFLDFQSEMQIGGYEESLNYQQKYTDHYFQD